MAINLEDTIDEIPPLSDVREDMIAAGYIKDNNLYIDKFLREDKSIILEWIEIAINIIIVDGYNDIVVKDLENYFFLRDIGDMKKQKEEETIFIEKFIEAASEANTGQKIKVVFG